MKPKDSYMTPLGRINHHQKAENKEKKPMNLDESVYACFVI